MAADVRTRCRPKGTSLGSHRRPSSRLDTEPMRLAMFAAMTEPILAREAPFFRLGSENLADLALLLDDHIAALGHAEGFFEQPKMIELRVGRMLERFEP